MNWREAYLTQALSDYEVFQELNTGRYPKCHKLHYLQMATEKLAKGFLCSPRGLPPKKTHFAFVRFLKVTKKRPKIRKGLGFGSDHLAYSAYIDSLLPVAERIEKLVPIGGALDKINAEYPWVDSTRQVHCPCLHTFPDLQKTELVRIQTLVSDLFRISRLYTVLMPR